MRHAGSLEERRVRMNEIKLVTAALHEAKVKDEEVIRVLIKICGTDEQGAINAIQNEKFILSPCRELFQYLLLDKGFTKSEADEFINKKVKRILAKNTDLSKLSTSKLYNVITK